MPSERGSKPALCSTGFNRDMADERQFTTLPRRALGDRRLSGMDLRVLGAISLHDGLSLAKGKGQGCYAGDRTLAHTANTDRKNVKRSTARLLECGYLFRDTDTLNRRGFVMRVIPDSLARDRGGEVTPSQQGASSPPIGGEVTPSTGGEVTPRIENQENLEESHKIDSAEAAHRDFVALRDDGGFDGERGCSNGEIDRAEARLGSGELVSIIHRLPQRFNSFKAETQLVILERAFAQIDRAPEALDPAERQSIISWLAQAADTLDVGVACHAERLLAELEAA